VVFIGDCGELVDAAVNLGIAHPSGYPIFCIAGKIFSFLPLSNFAFRINLVSALFAALSSIILYLLMLLMMEKNEIDSPPSITRSVAAAGSLIFSFSLAFWAQSVMTKGGIYTMNAFFIILALYLIVRIKPGDLKYLPLFCFTYGLSLAHHHTSALFAPAFLCYLAWVLRKVDFNAVRQKLKFSAFLLAAGFMIYLYLPIRSNAHPLINWGEPADLKNFLMHITRYRYGKLNPDPFVWKNFLGQTGFYIRKTLDQFPSFILIFSALGLWRLIKKNLSLALLTVYSFLAAGMGFVLILNFRLISKTLNSTEMFFIPSYLILALWAGAGLSCAGLFVIRKFKALNAGICAVILFLPVVVLIGNYRANDLSSAYSARDYGLNVLNTPGQNDGFLITGDTTTFLAAYFVHVEKRRQDISIYEDVGVIFPKFNPSIIDRFRQTGHSFYCTIGSNQEYSSRFYFEPFGILYRVPGANAAKIPPWNNYRMHGVNNENLMKDYWMREMQALYPYFIGEYLYSRKQVKAALAEYAAASRTGFDIDTIRSNIGVIASDRGWKDIAKENYLENLRYNPYYATAYYNLGLLYFSEKNYPEAVKMFYQAILHKPDFDKAYNNLGVTYHQLKQDEKAIAAYRRAIEVNPSAVSAMVNMANMYDDIKMHDKAVEFYNRALRVDPYSVEAHYNLGIAYMVMGRKEEARKEFEITLQLSPGHTAAAINLKKLK